jgi:xanthine dehydrogenase accessory factor
MKSLVTWNLIKNSLEQHIPVMLLYVLESAGSSPGRQGFFMAVNKTGEMEGSIGGGMMEHKFVELARERLRTAGDSLQSPAIRKQVHDKTADKNQSGMICSGEQTILLYPVQPGDASSVHHIIAALQHHRNGALLLSPQGIEFDGSIPEKDFEFELQSEENWWYREKLGFKNQLFIIGGGHCALALSQMMRSMDFYIRVYDDRPALKTMLENDSAHEKHFIDNYTELNSLIPAGHHHYVVIMTFGYRTDDTALRSLVGKDFKFIGLLGSQTKINKMFDQYRGEGLDPEWLRSIHTPVGVHIKSHTPEEIAVSIAAEIIRVKNL